MVGLLGIFPVRIVVSFRFGKTEQALSFATFAVSSRSQWRNRLKYIRP